MRLSICGLELPASLARRGLQGTMGWNGTYDEEQRVAAALGAMAHAVERLAWVLGIPLRYPLVPQVGGWVGGCWLAAAGAAAAAAAEADAAGGAAAVAAGRAARLPAAAHCPPPAALPAGLAIAHLRPGAARQRGAAAAARLAPQACACCGASSGGAAPGAAPARQRRGRRLAGLQVPGGLRAAPVLRGRLGQDQVGGRGRCRAAHGSACARRQHAGAPARGRPGRPRSQPAP